jgi:hypothetical protein
MIIRLDDRPPDAGRYGNFVEEIRASLRRPMASSDINVDRGSETHAFVG